MQHRLPKFSRRPEDFASYTLTDRGLTVIDAIARYRLIPTPLILQLVEGDQRTTAHHLQALYHLNLIHRFPLRFVGNSELCYCLHNPEALELLVRQRKAPTEDLDWDDVRRNRDNPFDGHRRRLFVDHQLVISRMHFMIELACRRSGGRLELAAWREGPSLRQYVLVDKLAQHRGELVKAEGTERLSHYPDAFFSLRIREEHGKRLVHFLYEADRGTMHLPDMREKFRSHFHYVVRQRLHQQHYDVDSIRAVLVETPDGKRADGLREVARHPAVCGPRPTPLFWFTISELFDRHHLQRPEIVLDPIWLSPVDDTARLSLLTPQPVRVAQPAPPERANQ